MRKLLAFGTTLCIGLAAISQLSLQTTITSGFAFPLASDKTNSPHNGNAMHYGTHVDMLAGGERNFRLGFGGFAGQILGLTVGDYKTTAQELATKYRLASDKFTYQESAFRSSAFLIGPIADWQLKQMNLSFWAKGGYSLNEPGRFSATIQDQGAVSRVYINQAGANKNSFACNLGGGLKYRVSELVSLQLAANYFDTKTELVNFNYDREKGIAPLNFTAHNSFIQAVFGLQFGLSGRKTKTYQDKTYSDIVNSRYVVKSDGLVYDLIKNNDDKGRKTNERRIINDTIIFDPKSIELKQATSQAFTGTQLHTANNFLTAFLYRTTDGLEVSQCSGQRSPGDPIPGLDIKLKNRNTGQVYPVRTNDDGSFSVRNMEDGVYEASSNNETAMFNIRNKKENAEYELVEMETGSCGILSNNMINVDGTMYAEVVRTGAGNSAKITSPRDIATGQASGKRQHKPFNMISSEMDLNYNNIVKLDGLLYAEVKTMREPASGQASGKRTFIHGDLDGDGLADRMYHTVTASQNTQSLRGFYAPPQTGDEVIILIDNDDDGIVSPRDAASGLPTGKRQHGSVTIVKGMMANDIMDAFEYEIKSPRDLASGQSSGKRQHGTVTIVKGMMANDIINALEYEVKSPRDIASGQSSGKRMHYPIAFIKGMNSADIINAFEYEVKAPRDVATGQSSGKRQHGFIKNMDATDQITAFEYNVKAPRDIATGQSSGKRQHGSITIVKGMIANDIIEAVQYEIKSPRDAASGQSSGKRQHGTVTIVKGRTADEDVFIVSENDNYDALEYEVKSPRDVATGQSSGRISRQDLDNLAAETGNVYVISPRDAASGLPTGKRQHGSVKIIKEWGVDEGSYQRKDLATGQSSGKRQHGTVTIVKEMNANEFLDAVDYNVKSPRDAASGMASGKRTHKPLRWNNDPYAEDAARLFTVEGSKGKQMEFEIPLLLNATNATSFTMNSSYPVESSKIVTKTSSNIQNNRMGSSSVNEPAYAIVNTSRSNIKNRTAQKADDDEPSNKATINTTRSNIKGMIEVTEIQRVRCENGTCIMNAIVNIDGMEYEAVISGVLKTKHDTAKNSIGNIR